MLCVSMQSCGQLDVIASQYSHNPFSHASWFASSGIPPAGILQSTSFVWVHVEGHMLSDVSEQGTSSQSGSFPHSGSHMLSFMQVPGQAGSKPSQFSSVMFSHISIVGVHCVWHSCVLSSHSSPSWQESCSL